MHVDTSVEHGGGVLADAAIDHGASSRVILDEVGDVVDNTGNGNEAAAVLGLILEVIPLHDWERLERHAPIKSGTLLIELLLQLLDATFLNFIGAELLQVVSQTELLPHPDGPFGRIVLMPFNGIAVVGWKLVMEVVVAFAKRDQCSDHMVTRRIAVVKGLISQPMGERVDAKGSLLDEEDPKDATVNEATQPIAPSKAADKGGEDKAHEEDDLEVVTVLPNHNGILIKIGNVGTADALGILLHQHPTKVRVEETLADRIWVFVGVGVSVMGTMIPSPPSHRALHGTTSYGSKENPKRCGGRV